VGLLWVCRQTALGRVLINAQIAAPLWLSKKRHSPLLWIRRIVQHRGHSCADPRPSCRLGRANSVGPLLHADAHPPG